MFIMGLLEESSPNCPRYGSWKGWLNIPSLNDFLMVEVMQTNVAQDRSQREEKEDDEDENALAEGLDANSTLPVVWEESKRDMDHKVKR